MLLIAENALVEDWLKEQFEIDQKDYEYQQLNYIKADLEVADLFDRQEEELAKLNPFNY